MQACIVWVDYLHARVFKVSPTGIVKKVIKLNAIQHSNGHRARNFENSEEKYFQDVVNAIGKPPLNLLVMGSGLAKNNFQDFLEKKQKNKLYKCLVGFVKIADLSDNQILKASRQFFKKYSLYHAHPPLALERKIK